MTHVPYKGAAPGITDLLAGQIQVYFGNLPVTIPHAHAGKVRALAVTSAKRATIAPELPTVAEAGVPGFELTPWHGVVTRSGTAQSTTTKLNQTIVAILREPATRERIANYGAEPSGVTQQQFAEFLKIEAAKWGKLVKDSGARAE